MNRFSRKYLLDIGERVFSTFIGGVLAAWIITPFEPTNWRSYAVGLVAAGLSALKGLAAKKIGSSQSASLAS